ncbi:uncharacterized protein TNCV_2636421 [Trichonephila clavipes]|uniref:DUF4371 domain-containing protein n=1 Tax=Trichonephila clavipes TaxID=2585209 RepID=A0A8X6UWT3_TRICX|nr:uncharacterized protein TNCV_2636421 [Trichonephila clavipes]
MQEAMLVAADSLFDDFKNKTEILGAINMLQLSARITTRKIELIASNLEAKLANDVETCEFFSIQLDESIDAVDTAQLAISVKMVFDDFSTKEEFLKILQLTARTQGKDIFSLFKKFTIENKLPLKKLSSITTDGARAMTFSAMGHERKRRQKKRKFHGNFRTAQKKVSEGSISSEKLGRGLSDTLFNVDSETLSGNRIFDIEILMSIFSILSCPVCYNQEMYLIEDSRLGLQSNLCLKCKNCSFTKGFTSTSQR